MMSQYLSITNTKQRELTESHKTNMCLLVQLYSLRFAKGRRSI